MRKLSVGTDFPSGGTDFPYFGEDWDHTNGLTSQLLVPNMLKTSQNAKHLPSTRLTTLVVSTASFEWVLERNIAGLSLYTQHFY